MDEMADAQVREMFPIFSEKCLPKLRFTNQKPSSGKVFARGQVRALSNGRVD